MNDECRFIIELAKQYKLYDEKPDELFKAINNLSVETARAIYAEYGEGERNFQSVNFLRAVVARRLIVRKEVTSDIVEDIKNTIREKKTEMFPNLPEKFRQQWNESPYGEKGDIFRSWKRDWSVFHTFFYRGETKVKVRRYLDKICEQLLKDLALPDYKYKWFDFLGTQHFGATRCWMVLTPKAIPSHKYAYQFFFGLESIPRAGIGVGTKLKSDVKDIEESVGSYEDALDKLKFHRDEIISFNNLLLEIDEIGKTEPENRKYYKFAPGRRAVEWERFKTENIIAADYDNLPVGDISDVDSLEDLNELCGFGRSGGSSGGTWHLWLLKSANVGDVVFVNKGVMTCIGIGIIEGEYFYSETSEDYKHRRKVRWLTDKIYEYEDNEIKDYPQLFRQDTFSPTRVWQFILSEYVRLYPELKEVFDAENLKYDAPVIDPEVEINEIVYETDHAEPYDFLTDADKPFISEEDFNQAVALLKRKKNIILQGSPGVGKTFIARKIAYQITGARSDAQIEMVQFHQSFAYEDFVQGLRLATDGTQIKNGVFFNFCQLARKHPDRPFFFIIDEINRGNLSKIFGELMMLIEHDKRAEKFALKLTYADERDEKFFVPPNVHLIGTMNTADRSLAIVDYALRRRFAFFTLEPQFGTDFRAFLQTRGFSERLVSHICESITDLNKQISADVNLGAGFQIGHSYFCGNDRDGADERLWFQEIVNFEIKPLLEEIWFDAPERIDEMVKRLAF